MSDNVYLVKPTTELKDAYMDFYREWRMSGEDMIPWVIEKDPSNFDGMVQSLVDASVGKGLPDGWVPDSTYWLVADNRVVGAVNIRHSLTDKLLNEGGHIGYGIRPSDRRNGYATRLLRLAIEKARDFGIKEVLVVCDENNVASKKTILRNGGIHASNFTEDNGNVINRFWIK